MTELQRHPRGRIPVRLSWRATRSPYGGTTAIVVCPKGHQGILAEHAIAADGSVRPTFTCAAPGCQFTDDLVLVGWEGA